ncbi:MAG: hypothetical protein V4618_00925 [Pseudomonadota bacterium]
MAEYAVNVLGENAVAEAVEELEMVKADTAAAAEAAIATVAWFYPFKDIPDEGSPLRRIREIRLLPSVAELLPARLSVRTLFRDHFGPGGAERFNFVVDGFTEPGGVDTYTPLFSVAAGGATINPDGIAGTQGVALVAASGTAFAGLANGASVGAMTFAFDDDGADFGNGTPLTIDEAELDPGKIQISAGDQRAIIDLIGVALDDVATTQVVSEAFARPVASRIDGNDIYLRRIIKDVKLWGTKPGHRYRVQYLKTQESAFEVRILEEDSGRYVATASVPTPIYTAEGFPDYVRFNISANVSGGAPAGGYTGISGYVRIDPEAAIVNNAVYLFDDFGDSGLAEDALITFDEVRNLFWNGAFSEVIPVAPGEGALMETVRGLYDDVVTDENDIIKTYWCPRAGPHHQILILLEKDEYFATNLFVPDWVSIGGPRGSKISRWNDNAHPPLQMPYNSKLIGVTVYSDSTTEQYPGNGAVGQYCVHSDINNGPTQPDAAGDVNFQINQLYDRVEYRGGPGSNVALWGSGLSAPGRVVHRNCTAVSENPARTAPLWASHTCANASATSSSLEFEGCAVLSKLPPNVAAVAVQSNQPFQVASALIINNCPSFSLVAYSGTVDGGWEGYGDYQGAVYSSDADVYLNFSTVAILRNNTGATIAAKRLCKTSGVNASLAAMGELIDAVSILPVADGAAGRFIVSGRTAYQNIAVAGADALIYVAAGVATTVATGAAVGRLKDGIVEFKRQF